MTHKSHKTRYSDSSLYDEICTECGATDAMNDDRLDFPCGEYSDAALLTYDFYVGRCQNCNKIVAAAIADTVENKLAAYDSIKDWVKRGLKVKLERVAKEDLAIKNWCNNRCKRKG